MSKALQILKACRERGQKRAGGLDLDEAIAELEEMMKPKSCETCSKYDYTACPCWEYSNGIPCISYCSEYEPKELS